MQITVNLTACAHAVRWMAEKAALLPSPLSDDVWSARSRLQPGGLWESQSVFGKENSDQVLLIQHPLVTSKSMSSPSW